MSARVLTRTTDVETLEPLVPPELSVPPPLDSLPVTIAQLAAPYAQAPQSARQADAMRDTLSIHPPTSATFCQATVS